jgi:hypothetical protein
MGWMDPADRKRTAAQVAFDGLKVPPTDGAAPCMPTNAPRAASRAYSQSPTQLTIRAATAHTRDQHPRA